MASRRAITRAQAVKYRSATRAGKSEILDAVCAVTGFNRDYARRALKGALKPRVVRPRAVRTLAMTSRVRLSWRSPLRDRRWRMVLPEEAGSGAAPAREANAASV